MRSARWKAFAQRLTTAGLLLVAAGIAAGQGPSTRIVGTAVSETGELIVGAAVTAIGSTSPGATSRDDGTFELFVRGNAAPRLVVRRIGFRPETVTVALPQPQRPALVVRLTRSFQTVSTVLITGTAGLANTTLGQVRERERTSGTGHFVFRDDFIKYNPVQFTDILRRVPGVQLVRTPGNSATVRLRENRCTPLFWLDGQALIGVPFDPNSQPASTIEAVEVYASPSLVPPQFQGPRGAQGCGSVVIWTRQGEFRARTPKIGADSIARLLDAQRVFGPDEVETQAHITALPTPIYPDPLRVAGVGGSATIEFIVEANGRLNVESIGIVAATHTSFADAVRQAVLDAEFVPARRNGRPVAQVFQLPVTFAPPPRP